MKNTTFKRLLIVLFTGSVWGFAQAAKPPEEHASDYYLHALILEKNGDLSKAAAEYEKALKLEPMSAYLHRSSASLALRMGELEKAAEEVDKAVALDPKDHDTRILAGEVYFTKGDVPEARAQLEQALRIQPDSEEALLNLAYVAGLKEPQKALDYYKKYLALHPGSPRLYERMALLYQELGNNKAAEESWKQVLAASDGSDSVKAQLSLGRIYEVKNDTATALQFYEEARRTDPHDLSLLLHLGQVYYKLSRSTEAISVFEQAYEIAPDNLAANFWLALLYEDSQNWPLAVEHMERVSQTISEPGILLRLSYYQAQAEDTKASLQTLEKLRSLDPDNPDYIYYVALGYEQAGQLRRAADTLKQFLKIKPNDAGAHFQLGTLLDRLGHFDEAVSHLLTAIELKPDYDMALNYLGYSWADRKIKLPDAEALILRAIRVDSSNAAYLDSLGWVYYQEARYAEADRVLSQADELVKDPLIAEHWGNALWKLDQKTKALELWVRSMQSGGESARLRKEIKEARKEVSAPEQGHIVLNLAHNVWAGVKDFSGLAKVTVEHGGHNAKFIIQIDYRRKELLRMEPLGPGFSGFLMLENGKWVNALMNSSAVDDDMHKAAIKIENILSGDFVEVFLDDPNLAMEISGATGRFSSGGLKLSMDMDYARVLGAEWPPIDDHHKADSMSLDKYEPLEHFFLPVELIYKSPDSDLKITISFGRLHANQSSSRP